MPEYFTPISELAKKLDIPAHTLRYWEKEFPSLIAPTTGAGGRRFYRPETVDNVTALKQYLYADGYTIDGVKKLIAGNQFQIAKSSPQRAESNAHGADIAAAVSLLKEARELLI